MEQTDLDRAQQQIKTLAQVLPEFGPETQADLQLNPALKTYLAFFKLPEPSDQLQLLAGKLTKDGQQTHLMLWKPPQSKGSVVIVHGYLDHTGLYGHLIKQLLERQLTVVCFDLIGHGLSSGEPASIESFDQYVEQLNLVLEASADLCPAPLHGIGQSTGGAILLKQLFDRDDGRDHRFASLNLLAPLVQPRKWQIDRWLFTLTRPFRPTMNRVFRENSQDKEFPSLCAPYGSVSASSVTSGLGERHGGMGSGDWSVPRESICDQCDSGRPGQHGGLAAQYQCAAE